MIASVAFRNFKALRNTQLALTPFNLVIGPNGSGKTSLIQALLRLKTLARLPLREPVAEQERLARSPEITFRFDRPHDGLEVVMACVTDTACDLLQVAPLHQGEGADDWNGLREKLITARAFLLDHYAMAMPARCGDGSALTTNGANLAAVLADRQTEDPVAFGDFRADAIRLFPEFDDVTTQLSGDGQAVGLKLRLRDEQEWLDASDLSQGTLSALGILCLVYDPAPPAIVCIEEVDRGIHPRLLREIRDALYRLSHPQSVGLSRPPVQVIATTHSPYMLDQYRDHPDEVVIAEKQGKEAHFSRLSDRPDLKLLLESGSLGDMWYSGILGGVPDE